MKAGSNPAQSIETREYRTRRAGPTEKAHG
jgi:hypothetical protein